MNKYHYEAKQFNCTYDLIHFLNFTQLRPENILSIDNLTVIYYVEVH